MKLNREAIKEFAKREIQYHTDNPFEATVRGFERWMKSNGVMLISEQEYACLMEMKERYDRALDNARDHQELSRGYKIGAEDDREATSSPDPID